MRKFTLLFLLVVTGCSPQFYVYTDQDPEADVRLFSKFRWLGVANIEANQNPLYYNELNDKRIKSAANEQLQNKGYILDKSNADLIVHYHIIVEDKGIVYTDELGYCYSPYWVDKHQNLYQYTQGTIIIDVMDASTNDLVWRGWAVSILEYERSNGFEKIIYESIARIFSEFPHSFRWTSPDL